MSACVGAVGGAKLGLVSALVVNGLYNGSVSNTLNVAHPIVFGGMAGAAGGYYAYTKRENIERILPKHSLFSKLPELFKTPRRSIVAGGATGVKLGVLSYLGYCYLNKKDDETDEVQKKSSMKVR